MPKTRTTQDYAKRLGRVVDHIALHLDDDLPLERLAEIACLSPYHFHRVYRGLQGETVKATIRRVRLSRAAGDLVQTVTPIKSVARAAGYGSVEAFTRAFSKDYGITPARYRERGSLCYPEPRTQKENATMYTVEFKDFPAMHLAAVRHSGSYMKIGDAFERLGAWGAAGDHFGPNTTMLGIYYDDPESVAEAELRSDAAMTIGADITADSTVSIIDRPAMHCAVIIHKGPYAELHTAYQWLYGEWLPQSGREPDDHPCHEIYLNDPRQTAPADLLTEIGIPIRA